MSIRLLWVEVCSFGLIDCVALRYVPGYLVAQLGLGEYCHGIYV